MVVILVSVSGTKHCKRVQPGLVQCSVCQENWLPFVIAASKMSTPEPGSWQSLCRKHGLSGANRHNEHRLEISPLKQMLNRYQQQATNCTSCTVSISCLDLRIQIRTVSVCLKKIHRQVKHTWAVSQ